MIILEDGTIKINDDILNLMGDTYLSCKYLQDKHKTFEKFVRSMITIATKWNQTQNI